MIKENPRIIGPFLHSTLQHQYGIFRPIKHIFDAMGTFKYTEQISAIRNCPPKACKQLRQTVFRFVFQNGDAEANFKPVALRQPKRCGNFNEARKCMSLGLSFFDTADNAEAFFRELQKRVPLIHLTHGDCLAQVEVTPDHGIATNHNQDSGHFTLHEFSGATWKWTILKALV